MLGGFAPVGLFARYRVDGYHILQFNTYRETNFKKFKSESNDETVNLAFFSAPGIQWHESPR